MNYNLRVEMERINGAVVTQVEISGIGRASRKRIVSPDFSSALAELKKEYDTMLAGLQAFHSHVPATPKAPAAVVAKPNKKKGAAKA